jgi:hypothetical protein
MTKEAMFFLAQTSKIITITDLIIKSNSNFRQLIFLEDKHNFASRTIRWCPINQPVFFIRMQKNISEIETK